MSSDLIVQLILQSYGASHAKPYSICTTNVLPQDFAGHKDIMTLDKGINCKIAVYQTFETLTSMNMCIFLAIIATILSFH